eukprot:5008812-Alexandrium_andersonii.AAC.1
MSRKPKGVEGGRRAALKGSSTRRVYIPCPRCRRARRQTSTCQPMTGCIQKAIGAAETAAELPKPAVTRR